MKTNILKRTSVLVLLSLPFLSLLLFSFSNPSGNNIGTKGDYSGEQLFQGIYFHHGEVADQLTTISKTAILDDSKELDRSYAALKQRLLEKDPAFFGHFKRDILSGSHIIVSETLKKTSKELFYAIQALNQEKSSHSASSEGSEDEGLFVVNPFIIIPPGYDPYPAVVLPSYVVLIVLPLGPPTLPLDENGKKALEQQSQTKLSGEILVNEIVQKL